LKGLHSLVTAFASGASRTKRHGAFYVLQKSRVNLALDMWKMHLPGVTPYYAVKCNPEPQLLNMLYDNGVSFDCASERELLQVQDLARGPVQDRIIYANPCKSVRDLTAAIELGAPTTVIDSEEEVAKLVDYAGGTLIRIAVDDTGSAMPFSSKFGCKWTEVERIGRRAADMGVPIHGISFHVGSGCKDGTAYAKAIESAYQCVLNLREKSAGAHDTRVIDIGGGFLPHYDDFAKKAGLIRDAIWVVDSEENRYSRKINWIAEPGRYIAGNAFDFFVQVIAKKRGHKDTWNYTIDDSLYGQFSSILFDHATPIWSRVAVDDRPRPVSSGTIFGRTCDSLDVIARATMEELEVGDWLWFPNMGAYTRATASEFNGFPTPPVFQASIEDVKPCNPPMNVRYMQAVSSAGIWA